MKSFNLIITVFLFLFLVAFTAKAEDIVIEAEAGDLINSATVANSTICSEGRKVGNLGGSTNSGAVVFDFTVKEEGTYTVYLYYLSGEERSFSLKINNNETPVNIICSSTESWDTPGVVSVDIELLAGNNTIIVGNDQSYAPDLDLVVIAGNIGGDVNPDDIQSFSLGDWELKINKTNGLTDILFKDQIVIKNTRASFGESSSKFFMEDLKDFAVSEEALADTFGTGKKISIKANTNDNQIQVTHNYYLYSGEDYILTDLAIESANEIASNYMAPVYSSGSNEILPEGLNQTLWVPYDNDKWIRYHTLDFGVPIESYEVTTLFNNETRKGLIVGSVEHDTWKTGIRVTTASENVLTRIEAYGGVTSNETRDVLPHGSLKGNKIRSPRIMIGLFDDWRAGMETYADVNEVVAPKLYWGKGKPFGWNSWGALQTNLSYTNASQVSEYFAESLQPNNFSNDSTVYIGLDSYWDNISYSNLIRFVRECKNRGQNAGIYWTPFVDWAKNPNRQVEGAPGYYYRDIYLYANGENQVIAGAYAIDPTHPASKARADLYLSRFIDQGFTFLKLDFLTHGSLESDSHYDPEVTTGIQAYNQGLKYIVDYLEGRMFLNFSISPLFPTQYGHGRRIACDAYANIDNTEYTLNSLSYGWWLDHLYSYNDADNVVFNGVSLGENRARMTSSVITGIIIVGDDYSESGYPTVKTRAQTFLTNVEVNRVAKLTKAFYPVESSSGSTAANMFMQWAADTLYLAVFNYEAKSASRTIDMDRLGLHKGTSYVVHELWEDTKEVQTDSWELSVPRRDVKFFKIYEGTISSYGEIKDPAGILLYPNPCGEKLYISDHSDLASDIIAYNTSGSVVKIFNAGENTLYVGDLENGLYLFSGLKTNGGRFVNKIIKNM